MKACVASLGLKSQLFWEFVNYLITGSRCRLKNIVTGQDRFIFSSISQDSFEFKAKMHNFVNLVIDLFFCMHHEDDIGCSFLWSFFGLLGP